MIYVQDMLLVSCVLLQMCCQSKQAECMQMGPLDLIESRSWMLQVQAGMAEHDMQVHCSRGVNLERGLTPAGALPTAAPPKESTNAAAVR
jgi:hypothetical protein